MTGNLFCIWTPKRDEMTYQIYYIGCNGKHWITDPHRGYTPLEETYKFCPQCGKIPLSVNQKRKER